MDQRETNAAASEKPDAQSAEQTRTSRDASRFTIVLDPVPASGEASFRATAIPPAPSRLAPRASTRRVDDDVPVKIRAMRDLYAVGDGMFRQRCKNFYVQGKFMEDYEDDAPYHYEYDYYYTTYHMLNVKQLRGYFTWRTRLRRGNYERTAPSLAYLYLYELINGIGAKTTDERFAKMREFEKNYIDAGLGDESMRRYLRRWALELAVVKGAPPETAREFMPRDVLAKDLALAVLRAPKRRDDDEILDAMILFQPRLAKSPALAKGGDDGKRLFAEVWRRGVDQGGKICGKSNLFVACFGYRRTRRIYPFADAVYYDPEKPRDVDYEIDETRRFRRRAGQWTETRFEVYPSYMKTFRTFVRAVDARLRRYLKTGKYLKENLLDSWAFELVNPVIEADRQAKVEAAKPKIEVDLSALSKIRADADVTRDRLLTEEETAEPPTLESPPRREREDASDETFPLRLDANSRHVLETLLKGASPATFARENRLMPSVVADSINEAFYDEIGDAVVECVDENLALVDDYVDDVKRLVQESNHGKQ